MNLRWLVLIPVLALVQEQSASPSRDKQAAGSAISERFRRQFNFYPGGRIQVAAGIAGDIKIIGWKRGSVLVEAEKIFYGVDAAEAKKLTDQYPVKVRFTHTTAVIQTLGPDPTGGSVEVHLAVYVPKDKTDLGIQVVKGDVAIGAINGWIEATLVEGNAEVKSLQGYFSLLTQEGDISVEMDARRWEGHGLTAATQKGTVHLKLPAAYSAALQLETRDGNIHIDFPEQVVEGESVPLKILTNKNARTMTASVGDGGAPLRLFTAIGDIYLTQSKSP